LKTVTPQLPTVLGSFAAMLVAFLGLINGTSPGTCMAKAGAAFLVFAGFGLILRFTLAEAEDRQAERNEPPLSELKGGNLDVIVPGTSVADLLGVRPGEAHDEDNDQAAA
jgi:hypothetical protein